MKKLLYLLIGLVFNIAFAQSPFGNVAPFVPGDKVLYHFDGSNCPVGDVSPDFKIIFKSYDCVDYKGKRWIRPLEKGTFLYRPLKFPENFSIEFTYIAFKEGGPFVRFGIYSKNIEPKILKENSYIYDRGLLLAVEGYYDRIKFGVSSNSKDAGSLFSNGFNRNVGKGQIHTIQISYRNGRVKFYIDGKRKIIKPLKFQNNVGGFGLFFWQYFATSTSISESPALITDIKISEYTGKQTFKPKLQENQNKEQKITPPVESKRLEVKVPSVSHKTITAKQQHVRCIPSTGTGEAAITTDYASAKMEAFARAKWDALEKALGTQVSVKSIVENFKLLDEVITKDIKGFIDNVKIVDEKNYGDSVAITIKGCVYPEKAEEALSLISKNTAFNVLLITQDRNMITLDEMNPVTTELINILNEQGFEVYDFASQPGIDPYSIEKAIAYRRFITLRHLLSKSLAGATIVGKIVFIYQTKSGQNIGYGISSPFNVVHAQAQYYLLVRDKGRIRILASGSVSAKGTGMNDDFAKNKAMKLLAPKLADDILLKIDKYLKSKRKTITVEVEGINSVSQNFDFKSNIQKLAWVKSVKDVGIGRFKVEYLENPIYLANALESILHYKVEEFTPIKIKVSLK